MLKLEKIETVAIKVQADRQSFNRVRETEVFAVIRRVNHGSVGTPSENIFNPS